MEKKRLYLIILAGLLASLLYDNQTVLFMAKIRVGFIDEFMVWLTNPLAAITIFLIITSLFLWEEKKRVHIIPLWSSVAIASIITSILKLIILRPRPFETLTLPLIKGIDYTFATWSTSFPSLHATALFSLIPILSEEFPKSKRFWITLASLIAFSRLYTGVHYLSDLLAGCLIGLSVGYSIIDFEKKYKILRKWKRKKSWK